MADEKPVDKTEEQIMEERIERSNEAAKRLEEANLKYAETIKASERLEEANQTQADLIARQEALNALGGKSEAGKNSTKNKKETIKEETKKLFAGTGLDPFDGAGEEALGED